MMNMPGGMPQGNMPPQGGMTPPKDAMSANRSIMNPIDMAAMKGSGTVSSDMTVRDLIEKVFKVPMDAPVSALTEAIKRQGMNKTNVGKMGAMANPVGSAMGPRNGMGPQGSQRPMTPPPQPAPQQRPQQGLTDLMR